MEAIVNTSEISNGFNEVGAYQHSFGLLKDHTKYYDPKADDLYLKDGTITLKGVRGEIKSLADAGIAKVRTKAVATTTGGAGTAGYSLIPVYVDPRIVDHSSCN